MARFPYHMVHQGIWAGVEIVQHKNDRAGRLHRPNNFLFIVARRLLVVLHRVKLKHLRRHQKKEIKKPVRILIPGTSMAWNNFEDESIEK